MPIEVRKRLSLKTGDRVEFVLNDHETAIRPACAPENPFAKCIGALQYLCRPASNSRLDQTIARRASRSMRRAIDSNDLSALWSREPLASSAAEVHGNTKVEGGVVVGAPVYADLLAQRQVTESFINDFF
jgi:bifunctional DNA-binding transcriptional regulator/antitoxin component of YhaV-PrlF toxin-antitoxin module